MLATVLWSLNWVLGLPPTPLKALLHWRLLSPLLEFMIRLVWGGAQEFAFLTGSLNTVIIWFPPPLLFIKPKLSDVMGSGHHECWNARGSVPSAEGLELKWTPHQWHPSCISGISFLSNQFQNQFMMVYKPGIWFLADCMSNPFLCYCPVSLLAEKETWGCRKPLL